MIITFSLNKIAYLHMNLAHPSSRIVKLEKYPTTPNLSCYKLYVGAASDDIRFSSSSCYLLTSERDEDNPFKYSNNFYFVFVNERRFKLIQANSQ